MALKQVYIVRLMTTAELWHSAVCAQQRDVEDVLKGHGIDHNVFGAQGMVAERSQMWESSKDPSQTASVTRVDVVDRYSEEA